jgi:hypothetical protein
MKNKRYSFNGNQITLFLLCSVMILLSMGMVVYSLVKANEVILTRADIISSPGISDWILEQRDLAWETMLLGALSALSALGIFFYFTLRQFRVPARRIQRQLELMAKLGEFREVKVRKGDDLEPFAKAINHFVESYTETLKDELLAQTNSTTHKDDESHDLNSSKEVQDISSDSKNKIAA